MSDKSDLKWFKTPIPLVTIESVGQAALILDEMMPNWAYKIDMYNFNLVSFKFCILGQLFGIGVLGRAAFAKMKWHIGTIFSDTSLSNEWINEISARCS